VTDQERWIHADNSAGGQPGAPFVAPAQVLLIVKNLAPLAAPHFFE
jgi:hypothetical protein